MNLLSISLIRYNLEYYSKTLKAAAPILAFAVFFFINYQVAGGPIWGNYYVTAVGIFVMSNWIAVSFINSEDKTQQWITRLHVRNDAGFHVAKIVAILVFMIPFYILVVFYPMLMGMFMRSLTFAEVAITLAIHLLFSLMGTAIGILFNADLHSIKNDYVVPLHVLIILGVVMPWASIFENNIFVRYAVFLLPPVNFLAERMHTLGDGVYRLDFNFVVFMLYALGYSLLLMAVYFLLIRKRSRR